MHLVVQPAEPAPQLLADARVERAERLVEEQYLRVDREGAREAHPLTLPAGELRRIAVAQARELNELEQLRDPLLDLHAPAPPDAQAEGDVLPDGHVLEGGVVLEDEANAALLGRNARHVPPLETDPAGIRPLETGDDAQEGRLAAAARTEQRRQRPALDFYGDLVESGEVAEALDDSACLDHRVSSFGFIAVSRISVVTAISASTTAEAYAPTSSKAW